MASTWSAGSANWSSDASPGWNGTGVPNAQGAVASKTNSAAATTTVDVGGGVTVGTISAGGVNNGTWSFTLSNKITLDQDGAGAGAAVIVNTGSGTSSRISLGTGTLTLADDLVVSNNSANATTASISITSTMGGAGNLKVFNIANDPNVAPITFGGANTFTGNVLIQKGAVTFTYSAGTGFGNTANAITLGEAGQGSVSFLSTGSAITLANPLTVAAGTGGTTLLGSTSGAASDSSFTGTVALNGDVTLTSSKAASATVKFTKNISGVGGVTKIGTGSVTFSTNNTYSGGTTISEGTLTLAAKGAITNSSGVFVASNATFDVSAVTGGFALGVARPQTLRGFGAVMGSVIVTNNGTISPGNSVGALTFSNDLTLAGTTFMELDKLGGGGSNDFVNVFGTLTLGGTLTVTNLGAALVGGDTFNLFDAGSFANSFATLNLPTLGSGLSWDTTLLNTQGILAIAAIPEPSTWALALAGLGFCVVLARREAAAPRA